MHGLPFAVKDTHALAGWRTTYGSPLMADHVPAHDDLLVARVRAAGAVMIGKTNVPEFAAGSHTFNPIFGTTRNPYDLSRSAGGSSGGAAAALAAGMVPLADGSDMGGSLRNPASFCNVVGLRPSLGRVPEWPQVNGWESTSVGGPLARNVGDLALLLSVMAGPDPHSPQSLPAEDFSLDPVGSLAGVRVAVSADLGGLLDVDDQVRSVLEETARLVETAGGLVETAHPDVREAEATFRTLRAWSFHARFGATLAADPEAFKASLADNIRAGAGLTGDDVARAYADRTALGHRMADFFDGYDVLVLPVSQVPPFPADQEYPTDDQRRADDDVPGLDALGVLHHRDRLSRDLGAGRLHRRRPAGGRAGRGPAQPGASPAPGGGGTRGAHRCRRPPPRPGLTAGADGAARS